jgi:hypothetical protein
MSQAKRTSRQKRPSKAVSVLGIAGVSLAAVSDGASASTGGSAAAVPLQTAAPFEVLTLGEEEISDVSLATFHVFDKDSFGTPQLGIEAAARGGCGCGHGCGGCGHGCGGARGCGGCGGRGCAVRGCAVRGCAVRGCGGCGRGCGWGGCGGCGWGWGWGGCCLSWGGCGLC